MILKIKYNLSRLLLLLLVLCLPLFTLAQDAPALFEKGNEQFAKEKYKDAIASYQKIINEGYQSAMVYFNLGNAFYKSGDIPSALLYYEKAHKLAPGDDDINFNIRLANSKTIDKIEEEPEFFIVSWWNALILSFSTHSLALISVLLFIAGFGVLIYYLFAQSVSLKRASFYGSISLLFLGLVTIFIASRQTHYFDSHHQGIIFGSTVKVKSEPTDTSKDLFVIHEGTKVEVTDTQNGWTKVGLVNGNTGWVRVADIKEI